MITSKLRATYVHHTIRLNCLFEDYTEVEVKKGDHMVYIYAETSVL